MNYHLRAVIVVLITVMIMAAGALAQKQAEVAMSFNAPGPSPGTPAWGGNAMWLLDFENRHIVKMDPEKGTAIDSLTIAIENPRAFAWAGKELWVLDQKTMMLYNINPKNGKTIRSIKAPVPDAEGEWSYEGLAWDSRYLWVAYFAGFSSKFVQVDPKDGREVLSFFCDCHPRGLASDGKNLWSISYGGADKSSKIDQRVISDKALDMVKSRTFQLDLPPGDLSGLSYDGQSFRYLDRRDNKIIKLKP